MAISTPVLKGTHETYAGGTPPYVTGSFNPGASGRLLIALAWASGNTNPVGTNLTMSGGGLTWTKRHSISDTGGWWHQGLAAWTAVSTGTGSMTGSLDVSTGSIDGAVLQVLEVDGADTTSPFDALGDITNGEMSTTDPTLTLSATTAATSLVLGFLFVDGSPSIGDPNSPFSELHERASGPANRVDYYIGARSTIPWVGSSATFMCFALGLEVKEAAAALGIVPDPFTHFRSILVR